jgi:hypothetical protein
MTVAHAGEAGGSVAKRSNLRLLGQSVFGKLGQSVQTKPNSCSSTCFKFLGSGHALKPEASGLTHMAATTTALVRSAEWLPFMAQA